MKFILIIVRLHSLPTSIGQRSIDSTDIYVQYFQSDNHHESQIKATLDYTLQSHQSTHFTATTLYDPEHKKT